MTPRPRAPWTVLLVAATLTAISGVGPSEDLGHLAHGKPAPAAAVTTAAMTAGLPATATSRSPLPIPPLPVPVPVVPLAPLPIAPASPVPAPPLRLPALGVPPLPVGPLPLRPLPLRPLPPPDSRVPALPRLGPSLGGLPLPLPGGRLSSAAALPVATGPTDTRPGPGPSFTLEATRVTLNGVRLRGLANPPGRRTPSRAPTVRIDVDSAAITAPTIRARHADRGVTEVRSTQVAPLTRRGQIYIEEITGTLTVAGLPTVRVRIAPGEVTAPGVDLGFLSVPSLTLTDVTARIAFLGAGQLRIPAATFVASVPDAEREQRSPSGP